MHTPDPAAVARITRAFDAALLRIAQARSFDLQEDDVSNALHQLYRLAVETFGEPVDGEGGWAALRDSTDDRALVPALIQLRHADVHTFIRLAEGRDVLTDIVTEVVGALVWRLPQQPPGKRLQKAFVKYDVLALLDGKTVLDGLHAARRVLVSAAPA